MKLKELYEMVAEDIPIRQDELLTESLKASELYIKYLKMHTYQKLKLSRLELEHKKLVLKAKEYYTGKADDEVYKLKPLGKRIMKGEVGPYVDADPEVQSSKAQILVQEQIVESLEKICNRLSYRGNDIKNAIRIMYYNAGLSTS